MCRAGTATACRSNGRSRKSTAPRSKDKDEVPVGEFRRECRAFADHWIAVQREEFKRLGVVGDWDHYYSTMNYESEAVIVGELGKFLMNGGLYKGSKPVLWSVVEKTALAEAEVEYHDHTSATIHVRFPVLKSKGGKLDGTSVVIWTTTPWTIPGNRAIAYGPDIAYVLVEVVETAEGSRAKVGEKMVLAKDLVGIVAQEIKATLTIVADLAAEDLEGTGRRPSAARPGLRLRRAAAGRRLRHRRCRHRLRAHRAGPWRGRLRAGRRQWRRSARHRRPRTAATIRTCRCSPASASTRRKARRATPIARSPRRSMRRASCWRAGRSSTATRTPGGPRRR